MRKGSLIRTSLIIVCSLAALISVYETLTALPPTDFLQDYFAATNLMHAESIYKNNELSHAPNKHPPFVAVLFTALTMLPERSAFIVFSLLSIFAYLILVRLCLQDTQLTPEISSLALAYLLVWNPIYSTLAHGQLSAILALLIIQGWIFARSSKQKLGGVLLGLATLIKLFPLLPLVIFYPLGYKRAFWSGIATVIIGLIFSIVIVGQRDIQEFFLRVASANFVEYRTHPLNYSFAGVIFSLFTSESCLHPIINSRPLAWALLTALSICAMGSCIYLAYYARGSILQTQSLVFGMALIVMTLTAPLSWSHGFLVLLPPLLLIFHQAMNSSNSWLRIVFFGAVIAFMLPDVVLSNLFKQRIEAGVDLWLFLIIKFNVVALVAILGMIYLLICIPSFQNKLVEPAP